MLNSVEARTKKSYGSRKIEFPAGGAEIQFLPASSEFLEQLRNIIARVFTSEL
jgi:hypothetical protein